MDTICILIMKDTFLPKVKEEFQVLSTLEAKQLSLVGELEKEGENEITIKRPILVCDKTVYLLCDERDTFSVPKTEVTFLYDAKDNKDVASEYRNILRDFMPKNRRIKI